MAHLLLHPPRMTDGKAAWLLKRLSPGDLELPFAPLQFRVRDQQTHAQLTLAAWWIPADNSDGRCAILLHGYADAKVGAIAWAPLLHSLGYNILALDLPAHGESDYRPISFGFWERHMVAQVIDELRSQRPDETRTLVLYGLSYGAFVAAATAAMCGDSGKGGEQDHAGRTIAAVVLDSPPLSPQRAAEIHFDLLGFPGRPFSPLAARLAAKLARADCSRLALPDLLQHITCPVLVIEGGDDPFMTSPDRAKLEAALRDRQSAGRPTQYLRVEPAHHLLAMPTEPQAYAEAVGRFLLSETGTH